MYRIITLMVLNVLSMSYSKLTVKSCAKMITTIKLRTDLAYVQYTVLVYVLRCKKKIDLKVT